MTLKQHDGHDPGHGEEGGMDMGHMMAMYFHTGTEETILFKPWKTDTTGKFIASLIGVFLLALFYEGLKFYRDYLYETSGQGSNGSKRYGLLGGVKAHILKSYHLIQTVLHMVQFLLSYFLMLIFMTYNVWLAIAITLGAGVGYLLFGWNKRTAVDITEHCH